MPEFSNRHTEVSIDIDDLEIDVEEFLEACSESDIDNVIEYLIDEGKISPESIINTEKLTISEEEYKTALSKLSTKWNNLTSDEENYILKIAKRF